MKPTTTMSREELARVRSSNAGLDRYMKKWEPRRRPDVSPEDNHALNSKLVEQYLEAEQYWKGRAQSVTEAIRLKAQYLAGPPYRGTPPLLDPDWLPESGPVRRYLLQDMDEEDWAMTPEHEAAVARLKKQRDERLARKQAEKPAT